MKEKAMNDTRIQPLRMRGQIVQLNLVEKNNKETILNVPNHCSRQKYNHSSSE